MLLAGLKLRVLFHVLFKSTDVLVTLKSPCRPSMKTDDEVEERRAVV